MAHEGWLPLDTVQHECWHKPEAHQMVVATNKKLQRIPIVAKALHLFVCVSFGRPNIVTGQLCRQLPKRALSFFFCPTLSCARALPFSPSVQKTCSFICSATATTGISFEAAILNIKRNNKICALLLACLRWSCSQQNCSHVLNLHNTTWQAGEISPAQHAAFVQIVVVIIGC